MGNKKVENLISRAIALDQARPLSDNDISHVEQRLKVILSNDFKELCREYCYTYFSSFAFFNFGLENQYSVIGETLALRKNVNFPHRYLALYEDDASFLALETKQSPDEPSPVIWCAIEDVYKLCDEKPLSYDPQIFSSFTEFFAYLLDQEEQERKNK